VLAQCLYRIFNVPNLKTDVTDARRMLGGPRLQLQERVLRNLQIGETGSVSVPVEGKHLREAKLFRVELLRLFHIGNKDQHVV
jgi:hypothetical protein